MSTLDYLDEIPIEPIAPSEPFRAGDKRLPQTVLDFWRWGSSDLLGNTMRGRVAEYIVHLAVGATDEVSYAWDSYDLTTPDGEIKIEVKSTSPWQVWKQSRPSRLEFGCGETLGWTMGKGFHGPRKRHADVYVFCVLRQPEPLDVTAWEFYVIATKTLDDPAHHVGKRISFSRVQQLPHLPADYESLRDVVRAIHKDAQSAG